MNNGGGPFVKLPTRACRPLRCGFGESANPPQEHDVIKQVKHLWCWLQQTHHHRRLDSTHTQKEAAGPKKLLAQRRNSRPPGLKSRCKMVGCLRSAAQGCRARMSARVAAHLQQRDVVPDAAHNQVGGAGVEACADLIHKQCLGGADHQLQGTKSKQLSAPTTAVDLTTQPGKCATAGGCRTASAGSSPALRVTGSWGRHKAGGNKLVPLTSPVVTRLRWPPDTPRSIWLPTMVSAHTCRQDAQHSSSRSHPSGNITYLQK